MNNQNHANEIEGVQKVATVSAAVLTAFFDALAQTDELGDIAENLRKLVLDDGNLSEPAIRAVLFPDAP